MGETVAVNGRGGYRSHTSHSSSHNPGDYGRLLCLPGSSRRFGDIINENGRVDIRGDGARRVITSQEISHY